jgi:hypothetical protein
VPWPGRWALRPPGRLGPAPGGIAAVSAPGFRGPSAGRIGLGDLGRGPDPEILEQVRLAAGAGDQVVQPPGREPAVPVGRHPQCAPSGGLALDSEPEELQLLQVAEG